jgi:Na+/H+ antiporter NhaC
MEDYGLLSLAPIALTIGLALRTRQIVLALAAGVGLAALILKSWNPWAALITVVDPLLLDAIADRDHVKVTLFTMLVAASLEVISQGKGTRALVERITRWATTRRGGMLATWGAGMVVFFDDYANCLIVGGSMRSVADRLKISREKLAYLVDSTAAPMATLALVSTWIGFEVSIMGDALAAAGQETNAYAFFLEGLPYRFYPFMALAFAFFIAFTGRDFGPMRAAEARASTREEETPDTALVPPSRAWLGALPILALVGVTGASLWFQGTAAKGSGAAMFEIIGSADGYDAMLHGSISAFVLAVVMSLGLKAARLHEVQEAALNGVRSLVEAMTVLFLAWAMGTAIGDLGAANFLVATIGPSVPAWILPTMVFIISAAIAFATGTSFGTMSIMIPIAIPLAFQLDPASTLALATSAAVLSGATWGDHCSPISDTTILSSTGTGCDHGAHVATQLPYALAAGAVSILLGTLPAGLGVNPWLLLLLGCVACWLIIRLMGTIQAPHNEHARGSD